MGAAGSVYVAWKSPRGGSSRLTKGGGNWFANIKERRGRNRRANVGGTSGIPKRAQISEKTRARLTPYLSGGEGAVYQLNIRTRIFNVIYEGISVRFGSRQIAIGEETRTGMTMRVTESGVAVSPVLPLPRTAYPLRPFRRVCPSLRRERL